MILEQQIGRAIRSTSDLASVLILDASFSNQEKLVVEEALMRFPGHVAVDSVEKAATFVNWSPNE